MKLIFLENDTITLKKSQVEYFDEISSEKVRVFKQKYGEKSPFFIQKNNNEIQFKANYFVGVDWLIPNKESIYIQPKLNENQEIDVLKMLLDVHSQDIENKHLTELVYIDWEASFIDIEQKKDNLTPFLIVQFLKILKKIVQKGLKKSHYQVQENLSNRIRGKIIVNQQVKQNVFKNQITKNICSYPKFGTDNLENRFLKKVLNFCNSYIVNNEVIFGNNLMIIKGLVRFSKSSFEDISDEISVENLKNIRKNPFFKEYTEALQIGERILKRFSYNITKTTENKAFVPPFWIDMPKLFELYVYQKMLKSYAKKDVLYHFSTNNNELDFLHISEKLVIDTKYKLLYREGRINTDDMRQVSGYARLARVYEKLQVVDNQLIGCVIIYPDTEKNSDEILDFSQKEEIHQYKKMYKLAVGFPKI